MHREIRRRRTFAIISHPDAGKTTLTEKLLLYGGALGLAGSVTARKNQRSTASDWMELERQRGISVSSTVLQFDFRDHVLNLLDTPGHKDFSEDTYRVLTAVDSAVMVIDASKGIEAQTRKLFEVCRQSGVPILTFINKLDRPARDPLELMDELEEVLGISAFAANWPIGSGAAFSGVLDRRSGLLHHFERTPGGAFRAPVAVGSLEDPQVRAAFAPDVIDRAIGELELLDGASAPFDPERILAGELTPVYFGSAVRNFGVELLLDALVELAPPPKARRAGERVVKPDDPGFSAFVFKIQANMDPRHRDRLAFARICSGRFERGMPVFHTRTGDRVRLTSSHRVFGRERETVDEAFAGDVVGIVGRSDFQIGDTLAEDASLTIDRIPAFAPEHFAFLHGDGAAEQKRFSKGLTQLLQEGVVQSFLLERSGQRIPVLGAVGPLQFDVVRHRLESEYGATTRLEQSPWSAMAWIEGDPLDGSVDRQALDDLALPTGAALCRDRVGRYAILFEGAWSRDFFMQRKSSVTLSSTPTRVPAHG
ncbi:peptide chain release factor 3 [Engelhardtia mirabilis]|uniref:Peptide chain release factor 3 n=1 Tax=Engelhardtia mirabilis TaxID=2528011 RepID=A0A518BE26_9BACT|nr:Peptide chain release factor 3 [Planctomycetes bacterium Pla133]QDU99563.1 Peptide chain release factor 3 [Planctomycetes bacterium Pla86]